MVRSPITCSLPLLLTIFLDLNSMVGYFSASKKWSLLRSLSRASTRVSTEFTSMVAETWELEICFSSRTTVPVTFVKLPVTFEMPKCRTVNCAVEWLGSMFHVFVCASAGTVPRRASRKTKRMLRSDFVITNLVSFERFSTGQQQIASELGSEQSDVLPGINDAIKKEPRRRAAWPFLCRRACPFRALRAHHHFPVAIVATAGSV